jgi:hypothetical protein
MSKEVRSQANAGSVVLLIKETRTRDKNETKIIYFDCDAAGAALF